MYKYIWLMMSIVLAGCASVTDKSAMTEQIDIQKVDSYRTRIAAVALAPGGAGLHVQGRLRQAPGYRMLFAGDISVEALDAEGRVMSAANVAPQQRGRTMGPPRFAAELDVDPRAVKTVRITHRMFPG